MDIGVKVKLAELLIQLDKAERALYKPTISNFNSETLQDIEDDLNTIRAQIKALDNKTMIILNKANND